MIAPVIAIAVGFLIGLAVGRWWALLAAVIFAIWIGVRTDVDEVPPWFLAMGYGAFSAAAIAGGVVVRQRQRRAR